MDKSKPLRDSLYGLNLEDPKIVAKVLPKLQERIIDLERQVAELLERR